MRILILLTGRGYGGVETHVYHLARALVRDGMQVALTSFTELSLDFAWEGELTSSGVRFVRPPEDAMAHGTLFRVLSGLGALRRQFGGVRFDRIIGQGHGGTLSLMRGFLKRDGCLLWHEYWHGLPTHGDEYERYEVPPARRFGWRMRYVPRAVDGIVTGCERARRNLIGVQHYGGPLLLIPPMTAKVPFDARRHQRTADGVVRIVLVGRLGFGKGAHTLLDLWPELDLGPAELHFHGAIPSGYGENIAKRRDKCQGVFFHGSFERSHLPQILANADLGLLLSIEEGFGLVACEYMAAGLPFVMTDCGAAEEFTYENPDAYRTAVSSFGIKKGIEEMVRRIRAGETSRARLRKWFEERFDWDRIAAMHCRAVRTEPKRWSADIVRSSRPA